MECKFIAAQEACEKLLAELLSLAQKDADSVLKDAKPDDVRLLKEGVFRKEQRKLASRTPRF